MIIKPDKHWLIWDFAHGVDINLLVFIGFFFFASAWGWQIQPDDLFKVYDIFIYTRLSRYKNSCRRKSLVYTSTKSLRKLFLTTFPQHYNNSVSLYYTHTHTQSGPNKANIVYCTGSALCYSFYEVFLLPLMSPEKSLFLSDCMDGFSRQVCSSLKNLTIQIIQSLLFVRFIYR